MNSLTRVTPAISPDGGEGVNNTRRTVPVSVAELQRRFGWPSRRRAIGFMKRLRHVQAGRDWFTTEEWLAEWVAANAVPAMDWPRRDEAVDPLEECVIGRVIQLIGELAARGRIRVAE